MKSILTGLLIFSGLSEAIAEECLPTPSQDMGALYKYSVANDLVDIGEGLIISGRVLSTRDCKPLVHARVEHWQAVKNGRYQDRLRAYLFTDMNGEYRFETEWPAVELPHIHFIVDANEHETLMTQWTGDDRVDTVTFDMVLKSSEE